MSGLDGQGWPTDDTPETDGEWNRLAGQDPIEFERNIAEFARKLERERDEWKERWADLARAAPKDIAAIECELTAAKCTLAKWIEWARMHGHLDHAAGIAVDTLEILSENVGAVAPPPQMPDSTKDAPGG